MYEVTEDRTMSTQRRLFATASVILSGCLGLAYVHGCGGGQTTWFSKAKEEPRPAEPATLEKDPREDSAALRDTIQSTAYLEGMRRLSVGGYGLVVGLGKNGTTMCPRPIREEMLKDLRGRYRLGSVPEAMEYLKPENLIDSEETAVVEVYGEVPAAARKNDRFDLTVKSLPGTDVRSLEGGWLMPCTLKLWANGRPVEGRYLGKGAGQVFINPFGLKKDAATKTDPRVGRVIGGGIINDDRRLRLVLTQPSAAIARRVMLLINRRFGSKPDKTADALNPTTIKLRIPEDWSRRQVQFLEVLMHLYVPAAPAFHDMRLRELCEEAVQPDAPLADISLAWEGMGKTVITLIRKLYTHENPGVSYFAARAGLRLNDDLAVDVVTRHARDENGPYRELAVEELGKAVNLNRPVLMLRPLLDEDNHRIRYLAYEALRRHKDSTIQSLSVGGKGGFMLDVVPTESDFLISAERSGEQRITLFGHNMRCITPVFYSQRNDRVMITSVPDKPLLKVVRKIPPNDRLSEPLLCTTEVAALIKVLGNEPKKDYHGRHMGLGLTYAQVLEVLHDLCERKTIDATFTLQSVDVATVTTRPAGAARPESEL